MKNILALVLTAALALCATLALANEVKTPHFSITLPDDWTQPNEIISQQGSSVALFQNTTDGTAVARIVASTAIRPVVSISDISTLPRSDRNPTERPRSPVCVLFSSTLTLVPAPASSPVFPRTVRRTSTT